MHTISIPHKNLSIEIPETVSEFTSEQYLYYCKLALELENSTITYFDLRIKLIYVLMGLKPSKKKLTKSEIESKNTNIYRLSLLCDGFFIDQKVNGKTAKALDFNFTDNKLPEFKHNGIKYIGPADTFVNLTFAEHLEASALFEEYSKTKDIDSLDRLVAVLYRPQKKETKEQLERGFDGDKRIPYYPATVDHRQKEFETLPTHYKYAVYGYFGAVSHFITTATNIPVLGKICDFTPLFKNTEGKTDNIGRLELLFALSKTKVFGNKQETEKELYWTILLELLSNHLETERVKRNSKK